MTENNWKLVDAFFDKYDLVDHHIKSYNDFVNGSYQKEASDIEDAYEDGTLLETPYYKHNAKLAVDRAESALMNDAELSTIVTGGVDSPVETIRLLAESGYSDEQIQKAKDYYTAYHRMNGLTDALLENVDSQIESANNEVVDHYLQYDNHASWMEIKVVDSAILSVEKLKQDTWALPVNSVVFDSNTGIVSSPFAAMVVGFGGTGLEAFKFLYEYSAFVYKDGKKTPFKCYAFDERMDRIEGLIRTKMPAIKEEYYVVKVI